MSQAQEGGSGKVMDKLRKRFSALGSGQKQQSAAQSTTANPDSANKQATQQPPPPPEKDVPTTTAAAATADEAVTDGDAPKTTPETPASHNYHVKTDLRQLYPPVEPFKTGMLNVDATHSLYWEASGNEKGVPVVFLHGGPGGGIGESDRRWFDPEHYCIYAFDQRGAGKSTPSASLENNTTWDLVDDLEKFRKEVGVDKWHVFGGSWGSCFALAYAQTHPDRVLSLVLRGIFTLRRSELLFLYQDGTSHIFPEYFTPYLDHIPKEEQGDLMQAYYKRLTDPDDAVQVEAARHWSTLEAASSKLYLDEEFVRKAKEDAKWAVAFARIESHFFVNKGWMEDGQLLKKENVDKIRHIPSVIIQGRYDVVCPPKTAYELHQTWPEAEFHITPDCGHGSREPGNLHQLILATDKMRSIKP